MKVADMKINPFDCGSQTQCIHHCKFLTGTACPSDLRRPYTILGFLILLQSALTAIPNYPNGMIGYELFSQWKFALLTTINCAYSTISSSVPDSWVVL
jgi:hypothetical protein